MEHTYHVRYLNEILASRVSLAVLRHLLAAPWRSSGAPALATAIGTSRASVHRRLGILVEAGLVRRTGEGRKVAFRIDPSSPLAPPLFQLVEIERLAALEPKVNLVIDDYMTGLDLGSTHSVMLFGSQARGMGRADSDVDVCVVFKGDTIPGGDRIELMAKGDVPTMMEVHEYSEDGFEWVPDLPAPWTPVGAGEASEPPQHQEGAPGQEDGRDPGQHGPGVGWRRGGPGALRRHR
jgi:DNA-binding transcriptional ArsR family regulator